MYFLHNKFVPWLLLPMISTVLLYCYKISRTTVYGKSINDKDSRIKSRFSILMGMSMHCFNDQSTLVKNLSIVWFRNDDMIQQSFLSSKKLSINFEKWKVYGQYVAADRGWLNVFSIELWVSMFFTRESNNCTKIYQRHVIWHFL